LSGWKWSTHVSPTVGTPFEAWSTWVPGDEPYVSLHFLGAEGYTKSREKFSWENVESGKCRSTYIWNRVVD